MRRSRKSQAGFTIIELMIATAVLSTILVLVTAMMIKVGNLYYKGISQARTQDNARAITDELAQHLRLSNGSTSAGGPNYGAFCIGDTRYTYVLYRKVSASLPTQHVLWRDTNPTPNLCSAPLPNMNNSTPSPGGTELIAPNSRLTAFNISGSSPYNISVGVAYGDDDLLCDSAIAGDCNFAGPGLSLRMTKVKAGLVTSPPWPQIVCKGSTITRNSSSFCSVARLDTAAVGHLP